MIKFLLLFLLFAAPAFCTELQFGPRLGVLTPGDINGVTVHPSSGLYLGAATEFPLSPLISVEFAAGVALDMRGPPGEQLPGYPSYNVHDADYFAMDLALSVNYSLLSLAAGPGYYYLHMDWEQDLTGFDREFKTIELSRIGYHFSAGVQATPNFDFKLVLLFPEPGNLWSMVSLTWLPFKVQVP